MNISDTMRDAYVHFQETGHFGGFRQSTVDALERRELVRRDAQGRYSLTEQSLPGGTSVAESEFAPRPNRLRARWITDQSGRLTTHEVGQADYAFYDRLRRGLVPGLELGGLFMKPLASKISAWSFGMVPRLRLDNPDAETEANKWWSKRHTDVLRALEEAVQLADAYVVVNADLTITVMPPQVVQPIVDQDDFSKIIGYRITEIYEDPAKIYSRQKITDEYYADRRVRTITPDSGQQRRREWRNLSGFIPVVPINFDKGPDEMFGHPVGEALVRAALRYYDRIFGYALDGNKLQGRPTPVISKMGSIEQINKFWETFGVEKRRDTVDPETGKTVTETYFELDFDADSVLTLGGDATFDWKSPGSFSQDTEVLLGLLFYLILQHSEIPEFIWGAAISSSRASTETQLDPFVRYIQKLQGQYASWVMQITQIVLGYMSLWDVNAAVDNETFEDNIRIMWPRLTDADGKLTLDAIKLAMDRDEPLLDRETALSLLPVDLEDPASVLDRVDAERQAAQDAQDRHDEEMMMPMQDAGEPLDGPTIATEAAARYSHIDFTPTDGMKAAARRALGWRDEYNRGGTNVGAGRARQILRGDAISPDVVRRMFSYFSRHEVDKQADGFSPGEDGYPSAGKIAWDLWGGDAGFAWARARVNQMDAADRAQEVIAQAQAVIAEQHTGVIVALELNAEQSELMRRATVRSGVDDDAIADWHHITLAYLGDSTALTYTADELVAVLRDWLSRRDDISSVSGVVQGLGRFEKDQGDGTHPVYASFGSPRLAEIRSDMLYALDRHGVTVNSTHGFVPHITLAYVPKDSPTPDIRFSDRPQMTFTELVVRWAGETYRLDFEQATQPV